MIAGHNLLDGIQADAFRRRRLDVECPASSAGCLQLGPRAKVFALYPLIPWVGVMAAGYALGPVFRLARPERLRRLRRARALTIRRLRRVARDQPLWRSAPWTLQDGALATLLSFVNCEKYPPSLLYLAMTLGPGLMLLAAFESARGRLADWVTTFGRVPFLYYVAHLFLIHALAVRIRVARAGRCHMAVRRSSRRQPAELRPEPAGRLCGMGGGRAHPLSAVPWFAALKQRRREWWLSYL